MKKIIVTLAFSFLFVLVTCFHTMAAEYTVLRINSDSDFNSLVSGVSSSGIHIVGNDKSLKVKLPSQIVLSKNMILENVTLSGECTIYANGYSLKVEENVTSDSRLSVYGGGQSSNVANTSLELYGGMYKTVYAGGYNGSVSGSTNLVFGGNCNKGDGINDQDSATLSPCYIYGGGNNGSVGVSTNVTFTGNAVARYIFGAGTGSGGTAPNTNIYISGGKVMNVYGGTTSTLLTGCNANITMTGGMAESVFGGSSQNSFDGNTCVTLLGGEVTRRVYTGCYNEWEILWKTSYYVDGHTKLVIGPDMLLNTQNGLASQNQSNTGVFAGSRITKKGNSAEINTIVYLDDCYSKQKSNIGDSTILSYVFTSHESHVVICGKGGTVSAVADSAELTCIPDFGNYLSVDDAVSDSDKVNVTKGSTVYVEFPADFEITDVRAENADGDTVKLTVSTNVRNAYQKESLFLYVSVNNGVEIERIFISGLSGGADEYTFTFNKADYSEVRAFILGKGFAPLCRSVAHTK